MNRIPKQPNARRRRGQRHPGGMITEHCVATWPDRLTQGVDITEQSGRRAGYWMHGCMHATIHMPSPLQASPILLTRHHYRGCRPVHVPVHVHVWLLLSMLSQSGGAPAGGVTGCRAGCCKWQQAACSAHRVGTAKIRGSQNGGPLRRPLNCGV
jgi:hypothetical protein